MFVHRYHLRSFYPHLFATAAVILALGSAGWLLSPLPAGEVADGDRDVSSPAVPAAPTYFEKNTGRYDPQVGFLARARGFDLFISPSEAVYAFRSPYLPPGQSGSSARPDGGGRASVRMRLEGGDPSVALHGVGKLGGSVSYFIGPDSKNWRSGVPVYSEVRAREVLPGIDLVWKEGGRGGIRYDVILAPGASPESVKWVIEGASDVSLDSDGALLISTGEGKLRHRKPVSFQESQSGKEEIESGFVLEKHGGQTIVGFQVGPYDRSRELVIDPTVDLGILGNSSFLGGSVDDVGHGIFVDDDGYIYVSGTTFSSDFPTTPGSVDPTWNQALNIFVTKFRPDGRTLVYSTYIGGNGGSEFGDFKVDGDGNVYVTGNVIDGSFPTTAGAFDESFNGQQDAVVAKIDPAGSSLVYSTFFGGTGFEVALGIDVDPSGAAYIAGVTGDAGSATFPVTDGAFDTTINGLNDGYVAKFSTDGSSLAYCSFLGSAMFDDALDVAVDSSGRAVVVGSAGAGDFPTTKGAFDETFDIATDAFVTKFEPDGSALTFSTFVGAGGGDIADSVVLDDSGNIFVTGSSNEGATAFPTTPGAYDETPNGITDAFVFKMKPDGTDLVFSTLLGGSLNDFGHDIAVDASGNSYITGKTSGGSPVFPTTPDAFDSTHNGFEDGFAAKISADGSSLDYSTFFGAGNNETSNGVAVDKHGNVYITGMTRVAGIPISPRAFDSSFGGNDEGFFASFGCRRPRSAADLDCDGGTDISVFRPTGGIWYSLRSNEGFTAFQFGSSGDVPVPGDYDGDLKEDFAVFRPSNVPGEPDFYVLNSSDLSYSFVELGAAGDVPVNGDFDADGRDDIGVFRPSEGRWYIVRSSDLGVIEHQFGQAGDLPVRMDFNGDSATDLAVFRPGNGTWYVARPGGPPSQNYDAIPFGISSDIPVAADYDGDYRTDIAVFRPSNGVWYILKSSDLTVRFVNFGISTDIPVPGDYDADGMDDVGIFRDGTWWLLRSTDGLGVVPFGIQTDIPLNAKRN